MEKVNSKNAKPLNSCHADWFGSHYYHVLYKHRNKKEAEKFLKNLLLLLQPEKKSRMLDLACGRGRHTQFLLRNGFDAIGIDLSEENIAFAKKNSSRFFVGDMRNVFKKNYFDIILNLFTSFGYFESENDDMQVLKAVHSQLKKNGIFVLDFLNVQKAIANLIKEENKIIDGVNFNIKRAVERGFICKKIIVNKCVFEEKVKVLVPDDFKKYFSAGRFKVQQIFGDYDLNLFDEKKSERLIFVANQF